MITVDAGMPKILKVLLVVGVIVASVQTGWFFYSSLKSNGMHIVKAEEVRTVAPVPYTVRLIETHYRPDGSAVDTQESIWAVRSDGASVRHIMQKQSKQTSERTIKFVSGEEIVINELTNIKSTTFEKSVNSARWQRDPSSKCINSFAGTAMTSLPETISGEETVNGYRTVRISANNVTSWYALDYGCALIRDKAEWGTDKGYSEHNAVLLVPGEPDEALFKIPVNAREAPPSERLMSSETNGASNCGAKCMELLQKFDARYYANRPAR